MKLIGLLLKLVLYVVLTFVFVVIYEYGITDAPSHMQSEFEALKQEFTGQGANRQ